MSVQSRFFIYFVIWLPHCFDSWCVRALEVPLLRSGNAYLCHERVSPSVVVGGTVGMNYLW